MLIDILDHFFLFEFSMDISFRRYFLALNSIARNMWETVKFEFTVWIAFRRYFLPLNSIEKIIKFEFTIGISL